jgi:hypothetical protein
VNIDDVTFKHHKEITVQARTLDSILKEAKVKTIDLLSIDVEGAELEVLLGTDLKKYRPRLILLEDKHLYLTKHRYLNKNGYSLANGQDRTVGMSLKGLNDLLRHFLKNFFF